MHLHSGLVSFCLVIMGGLGMSVFPEEEEPVIRVGPECESHSFYNLALQNTYCLFPKIRHYLVLLANKKNP